MTHAVKSSSFGATRRGYVFDDSEVVDISFPIQTIKIRSGDAIDSIQGTFNLILHFLTKSDLCYPSKKFRRSRFVHVAFTLF